jgi:hypothetical protein
MRITLIIFWWLASIYLLLNLVVGLSFSLGTITNSTVLVQFLGLMFILLISVILVNPMVKVNGWIKLVMLIVGILAASSAL